MHFAAGFATSMVAIVGLFTWAAFVGAAEVPREAYEWRRDIIREGRAAWGLAAPTATFAAQIEQESAYRADARSRVGAAGMAQFMPATARWIAGAYPDLGPPAPLDPRWSIRALVRYNRHLWDRIEAFDGCERMAFTLAAYNGGLGHVYNRQRMSATPLFCLAATCDLRPPGVSEDNQRENSRYPRRILLVLEPRYAVAGFGTGACHREEA